MFIQACYGVDFLAIPERAFLEVSNSKGNGTPKIPGKALLARPLSLVKNFNSLILFFAAVPTTPPTTGAV